MNQKIEERWATRENLHPDRLEHTHNSGVHTIWFDECSAHRVRPQHLQWCYTKKNPEKDKTQGIAYNCAQLVSKKGNILTKTEKIAFNYCKIKIE